MCGDLVSKRKLEMLFVVPLEVLFLLGRKRIVDSNGVFTAVIKADDG